MNETTDSHIFFWFFPASGLERNNSSGQKPLVLWLNGGPSQSSLMGVFLQNGPFAIDETNDLSIKRRAIETCCFINHTDCIIVLITDNNLSWHRFFNMLYIDQPVGTGFSYTNSKNGYITNMSEMAEQLYLVIIQFLQLFPWFQSTPLFIAGESFAGKYIPAIAYKIYNENGKIASDSQINLHGIAMGNALTDPMNMLNYADYAYQLGFIDDNERVHMQSLEEAVRQAHPRV